MNINLNEPASTDSENSEGELYLPGGMSRKTRITKKKSSVRKNNDGMTSNTSGIQQNVTRASTREDFVKELYHILDKNIGDFDYLINFCLTNSEYFENEKRKFLTVLRNTQKNLNDIHLDDAKKREIRNHYCTIENLLKLMFSRDEGITKITPKFTPKFVEKKYNPQQFIERTAHHTVQTTIALHRDLSRDPRRRPAHSQPIILSKKCELCNKEIKNEDYNEHIGNEFSIENLMNKGFYGISENTPSKLILVFNIKGHEEEKIIDENILGPPAKNKFFMCEKKRAKYIYFDNIESAIESFNQIRKLIFVDEITRKPYHVKVYYQQVTRHLFVRDIFPISEITNDFLRNFFSQEDKSPVENVIYKKGSNTAIVSYFHLDDAIRQRIDLNLQNLNNANRGRVKLNFYFEKEDENSNFLKIANLPDDLSFEEMFKEFKKMDKNNDIKKFTHENYHHERCIFLECNDNNGAKRMKEILNDQFIGNRHIRVILFKYKKKQKRKDDEERSNKRRKI